MRRLARLSVLSLVLAALPAGEARAQALAAAATAASPGDSLTALGRRDGRAAARARGVGGRAALGFVGGLPVGFFGVFALYDRDPVQVLSTGAGLGLVLAAAEGGPAAPPGAVAGPADARGAPYAPAFRAAYAARVRARRRTAALLGGAAGTAAGFGALIWLLSQITT